MNPPSTNANTHASTNNANTHASTNAHLKLQQQTSAYFTETLLIADAPQSLLANLYHAHVPSTEPPPQEFDPDASFASTVTGMAGMDGSGASGNVLEEASLEVQLFVDGVTMEMLEELSQILADWKQSESDGFWKMLISIARGGPPTTGVVLSTPATARKARSHHRRSSIRLSVARGETDTAAKGLIALCYHLIQRASEGHTVAMGYQAAQIYFQLLTLPGHSVYGHIFTPIVFHDGVRLMQNYQHLLFPSGSSSAEEEEAEFMEEDVLLATQPSHNILRMDVDKDGDDDEDEVEQEESRLARQILAVLAGRLLPAFPQYLKDMKWKKVDEPFKQVVQMLVDLVQIHGNLAWVRLKDRSMLEPIRSLAFSSLEVLADPSSGELEHRLAVIYMQLVPVILMRHTAEATSVPKAALAQNEMTIAFVRKITQSQVALDGAFEEMDVDGNQGRVNAAIFKSYILAQHIAVSFIDKSDHRAKAVQSVMSILEMLPLPLQLRYTQWVSIVGNNPKNGIRGFAVELYESILLQRSFPLSMDAVKLVMNTLAQKALDKSPTVRARALTALANVFEMAMRADLQDSTQQGVASYFESWTEPNLATGAFALISARIVDEKSVVRKAAISLARYLIGYELEVGSKQARLRTQPLVATLEQRFRDPVMTLRKLTVRMLTDLVLEHPEMNELWGSWKRCVFVGSGDNETAVQEECSSCVDEVILQKLCRQELAFQKYLLPQFTEFPMAAEKCLRHSFGQLAKKSGIRAEAIQYLQEMVAVESGATDKDVDGCWVLLASMAPFGGVASIKAEVVMKCWKEVLSKKSLGLSKCRHILSVMETMVEKMSVKDASAMLELMKRLLANLQVPLAAISAVISTINAIDKKRNDNARVWCVDLLQTCEVALDTAVKQQQSNESAEEPLVRILFTLGELALFSPAHVTPKIVTNVQVLVASAEDHLFSTRTRAFAFITLGKICLQNEEIAKDHVPVFARELEMSPDASIRNNAMMVLGDLCKRYTRVVDQYIPTIANCLQDPTEQVRMQTLLMLTKLLQEDYIKWKGALFFKFVTATVDSNRNIAEFARESLIQMATKYPLMFYSNFVDCIFYLNDFVGGNVAVFYNRSVKERRAFTMRGSAENERKRRRIYTFLLKNLADDQRFQLTRKLCLDILRGTLDGSIDIADESGSSVVVDTLYVLASKDIKCSLKLPKSDVDGGDEDVAEAAQTKLAMLSSKIHSQISRKIAIENIIPIIIQLKHVMEQRRSPLLKHVMMYLREVVKDFRVEMEDLLVSDRQLAREIEFDLRQFEAQQKQQKKAVAAEEMDGGEVEGSASKMVESDDVKFKAPFPKLKRMTIGKTVCPPNAPSPMEMDETDLENDKEVAMEKENQDSHVESDVKATPMKEAVSVAQTPILSEADKKKWKIRSPVAPPKGTRSKRRPKRALELAEDEEEEETAV